MKAPVTTLKASGNWEACLKYLVAVELATKQTTTDGITRPTTNQEVMKLFAGALKATLPKVSKPEDAETLRSGDED